MTKEEKELLLKDLCARLPYGVMVLDEATNCIGELFDISTTYDVQYETETDTEFQTTYNIKPYLRPMSSMTEEEKKEFDTFKFLANTGDKYLSYEMSRFVDWLNQHMFDYRGLIEKGLALEAPEGMYKTE